MSFRIPVRPAEAETIVRGSRFRAWVGPAADVEEAGAALVRRATAGKDATHHCWAYRLWRGGRVEEAGFDAGEPGGTAGRPILGSLQAAELIQTVCVVSRWFGGVKLGTGGLVRAYGGAAAECLRLAPREPLVAVATLELTCPFDDLGHVHAALAAHQATKQHEAFDETGARLVVQLPADRVDALKARLRDATRDRVRFSDA